MRTVEDNLSDLLEKVKQLGMELEASLDRMWIPVTERLPEKGGLYFVTKENDYGSCVATEWFYQGNTTWSTGWKVVAWMPLPKPYEERGEQNDNSI